MADVTSYDQIIQLISDGLSSQQTFYSENQTVVPVNPASIAYASSRRAYTKPFPSLPSGVTKYRVLGATGQASNTGVPLAIGCSIYKAYNLGSLTLGDGAGGASSFADGVAMPTVTQLGNSVVQNAVVIAEVTTALTATPGNYTFTYKNQAGTGGQTSETISPVGSAPVRSMGYCGLATGDTGVQDITASSRAAGTNPGGVIKFWGVVPVGKFELSNGAFAGGFTNLLTSGFSWLQFDAADQLLIVPHFTAVVGASFGKIWTVGER
jgi:hypothetical protein